MLGAIWLFLQPSFLYLLKLLGQFSSIEIVVGVFINNFMVWHSPEYGLMKPNVEEPGAFGFSHVECEFLTLFPLVYNYNVEHVSSPS